jgi:UDP-N-acetylglucosamine--N-acetylmuramyl-(pentapeptide) pyrophosphoryl-undecaprenol N-acetylglucosamine transferase
LRLFKSVIQALFIIRSYKPDVLLAMGGYASAPGVIAAWMLRVPVIIHEQNARAGMTNKYLAKLATKTLAGFAGAFPEDKCVVVGNPVRQKIIDIAQKKFSDERELRILVIGGSQGAKFFNDNFPEMFYEISKKRELKIFHQVGKRQIEKVEDEYIGQNARAVQFIDDMPVAYEWADVVIARAGASTVAELAACAVPSIFVPFPAAVDDHQYYNAQGLQQAGAAWVVRQGDEAVSEIMGYIIELNSDKLYAASQAARTVAAYKSTDLIAAACMDIGTKGA